MKIHELAKQLDLTLCCGKGGINNQVAGGYVSDLLSDVMGSTKEGELWITLQTHKNVMAIASLKELSAVILVKGFQPEADMALQSDQEDIPVYSTPLEAFEITGKIYQILKEKSVISS